MITEVISPALYSSVLSLIATNPVHPRSFYFFVSLIASVGIFFVAAVVINATHMNDHDTGVFGLGFSIGGFATAWLLDSLDKDYVLYAAAGYGIGIAGCWWMVFRGGKDNG